MRATAWLCAAGALIGGCIGDLDPDWQLDHTRIVAIRATPPSIPAGATSVLDALMAHKGSATDVEAPIGVEVSPIDSTMALQGVSVALVGSDWTVTAPTDDVIDAARTELMLDAGAPVPLVLGLAFGGGSGSALLAEKVVYLGGSADNPVVTNTMVDGALAPAAGSAIVIPGDVDVPISTDADPTDMINWLTSCGTMHDDNEVKTFMHVLPTDPMIGELAVVRRDALGGVAFETWPISATPAVGSAAN